MYLRKLLMLFSPVIAIIIIALICVRPAYASSTEKLTVVIDAGHGGVDSGVIGVKTGVKESDLNLAYAKELEVLFKSAGFDVVLTRNTSAGLYGAFSSGFKLRDLSERVKITKSADADVFISVHMNKYGDPARRGAQVFFKIDDEHSKNLAERVQNSFNRMPTAVRECQALSGDYYVLNGANCPAVICECGFLSSPEDEALLIDESYMKSLCHALFSGVTEYFAVCGTDALEKTNAAYIYG